MTTFTAAIKLILGFVFVVLGWAILFDWVGTPSARSVAFGAFIALGIALACSSHLDLMEDR
jgi:hypothetical protein